MFGTKNENLPEGKVFIKPGINEVEVVSISDQQHTQNGKPYFDVELKIAGESDDSSNKFKFFTSEKAFPYSMLKMVEIVYACLGQAEADKIQDETFEGYLQKLNQKLKGKKYIQKFVGEEYVNSEGNVKIASKIPFSRRTKKNPILTIAAPIGKQDTLSFDEEEDITRIEKDVEEDAPSWGG